MIEEASNISPVDIAIGKLRSNTIPEINTTGDFCIAARAYMNTVLAQDDLCRAQFTDWVNQKKQLTEALNNDRGMSQMEEMKFCLQFPDILGNYLLRQFPEILENKSNMYKFMKAFPEFTVPKKAFKTKYDSN